MMDISGFTQQISPLTSSALKRASVAIGYGMACSAQKSTTNTLPDTPPVSETTHEHPVISSRKVLGYKTTPPPLQQQTPVLEQPCVKSSIPVHKKTTRPLPRGKISQKEYYKTNLRVENRMKRRDIRQKIMAGQARKESWNPLQIMINHWNQLSSKEQEQIRSNIDHWVTTGCLNTQAWLKWNLPKVSYQLLCLVLNQESPDFVIEGFRMIDTERDLYKFWTELGYSPRGTYF